MPAPVYDQRAILSAVAFYVPVHAGCSGYPAEVAVDDENQFIFGMDEDRPEIWFGMSTATTAFVFLLAFWFI